MKRGPQAWSCRSSRCAAAGSSSGSSSAADEAIVGSSDGEVLEAALQQFYEMRTAPPEVHVPAEPDEREALESVAVRARRPPRAGSSCRSAASKRGLVELAKRNAALAYQTRFNPATTAQYDALETLQAVLALPALPRRIECFDISTIQGSETVASMVVCEDGRMRRGGIPQVPASGATAGESTAGARTTSPRCSEVVLRRYRELLEQGGPFPDLILIDGGKGQLSAAYAALEALGLVNLVAVGIAKKEELLFTRDRDRSHRARRSTIRRCCCCSGFATRRIASR